MSEIKPFRGVVYDRDSIDGNFADVLAPPYDVISEEKRDELYDKNPYNVVKLILGKDLSGDNGADNKYIRAKHLLTEWTEKDVLVRDADENIYVYVQEYECEGKSYRRVGFISLMKIGEDGNDSLLPHEKTLAKPKEDRMRLIKAVETNLSPIFVLFYDEKKQIDTILSDKIKREEPFVDVFLDDVRHLFWKVSDKEAISKVSALIKDEKTFVADGHHRYEVAKQYRDYRRENKINIGNTDYVMVYFTNMAEEKGITVFATHRVIKKMPDIKMEDLISKLSEQFNISVYDNLTDITEGLEKYFTKSNVFGLFFGGKYLFMEVKDRDKIFDLIEGDRKKEWKELDVSMLHAAVFDKILSVKSDEGNITYVRDAEKGVDLVLDGTHDAVFIMNPTKVGQLKAVAEHGEMMPQKSTYFYPKLITGLVINKFDIE